MDSIEQDIGVFLGLCRTASLATADAEGRPHAANIQFALDERRRFVWVSSPSSAHSSHIARRPEVALAIYSHDDRPGQIQGLQVHGVVEANLAGAERDAAWSVYVARFPFVEEGAMRRAVDSQSFYRLTPTWLRWIDNRRGFGFKVEKRF